MKDIKIKDFSYNLPDEKIAKYPLPERDKSKLLVYNKGVIEQKHFSQISVLVPPDSLLVVNDTKVIQARMFFRKQTGAKIEIFCLNPHFPADYETAFSQKSKCQWTCIVGNSKKWKSGELKKNISTQNSEFELIVRKISAEKNNQILEFKWNADITFGEILENSGNIPIPPYLNRNSEESDKTNYQTVYSQKKGSVAAPTAGLHFTPKVFGNLALKNIKLAKLTLHVGAGTFKPVKSEKIGDHEMHTEQFSVSKEFVNQLIKYEGKITSVGTTSMRTLESLYWLGVKILHKKNTENKLFVSQWEVYEMPQNTSFTQAINAILEFMQSQNLSTLYAETQIIIVPTYKFRVVNNLITNFHQPQSTLLLLVGAFVGDDWKKIYDYALQNDFRFLSYGDSSFLARF